MVEPAARDATYDQVASKYDAGFQGPRWALYDEVTLATAARAMPPGPLRMLDAGAGSGRFALRFLDQGHHVTLLDPSPGMLDVARERVRASGHAARAAFQVGSIDAIDAADGTYDFVFCEGDPLSYCYETKEKAAAELVRILRPGGGLYVSVDSRVFAATTMIAMGDVTRAVAAMEQGVSRDPYGLRVHAFFPDELAQLLRGAGAVDVRVTGKVAMTHVLHPQLGDQLLTHPEHGPRIRAFELQLADDPTAAAMAGHLHATARKPA